MASDGSLLSEEQLLCSICLSVFNQPVSIQCGHNFCKACITGYWDSSGQWLCPLCKRSFDNRPDLFVNTLISEMAIQIRKSAQERASSSQSPDQEAANPGDVLCDICPGKKLKALKTCLVCFASYCETHLEPHRRVATLKRHQLVIPVENLEDRMCKTHSKVLELFCRTDQLCICMLCSQTKHKKHDAVSLKEEYKERKSQVGRTKTEVQQMIEKRLQKVQEIKHLAELNRTETKKEVADCVEVFTVLVSYIQRKQAELTEIIEEKERSVDRQAEGLIDELEQEITELQRRNTELEQLENIEDHLHLLQRSPPLSTPPATKDWSEISVGIHQYMGTVRGGVTRLQVGLNEEMETLQKQVENSGQMSPEAVRLNRIQELYETDVTLDPDTAHPMVAVSNDGKQVQACPMLRFLHYSWKRFDTQRYVLGKQGFSGRFYYEVQVEGINNWVLGVAKESINRKGMITLSPDDGYWAIAPNGARFAKIGVFVDYKAGEVSFYDVEAGRLMYSFEGCTFTERLYPLFHPGSKVGHNAPMIITPVKKTRDAWASACLLAGTVSRLANAYIWHW